MSHTEWQFSNDKELEASLHFARAHVERAISDEHVEYYKAQVHSIMNEKRMRNIIRERDERNS